MNANIKMGVVALSSFAAGWYFGGGGSISKLKAMVSRFTLHDLIPKNIELMDIFIVGFVALLVLKVFSGGNTSSKTRR